MASRDFLGVLGGGGGEGAPPELGGSTAADEIELGLGLSLGGLFGTDRSPDAKRPRLARSTSIASVCSVSFGDVDGDHSPTALLRTSSLPTDTEEERCRRREMQSRRRLETRRKMLDRRSSIGSSSVPGKSGKEDGNDVIVPGFQLRSSTGSQGTEGSSSSNYAKEQVQALDNIVCLSTDIKSSSTADDTKQNSAVPPPPTTATGMPPNGTTTEQPPLRTLGSLTTMASSSSDMKKKMMEDMPMVSSKVEGPDGKKIDGFLYRYRKGGDGVRIVCVCHGSFLTPGEFVKHAGGGDVSNPLRHIVVHPSPSSFL